MSRLDGFVRMRAELLRHQQWVRVALLSLAFACDEITSRPAARALGLQIDYARRRLAELEAHGLVTRYLPPYLGRGMPHYRYRLTERGRAALVERAMVLISASVRRAA